MKRLVYTRRLRTTQILWASIAALIVGAVLSYLSGSTGGALISLTAAAALLLVPLSLKYGSEYLAAALLLAVQLVTVTALVWNAEGLADEAMLGYPGVMIFAAMIGDRRFFLPFVAAICICILGIGLGDELGWRASEPPEGGLMSAIIILIIIGVTAFGVWLLSGDVFRLLARLTRENARFRRSQEALEHMAHHDALTELPNRTLARYRFEQAFAQCRRDDQSLGVAFLDLDHFKHINDAHGHQVGDQVLIQVAQRLSTLLRESDTVCRLGGDEFLVLLSGVSDHAGVAQFVYRIMATITEPIEIGELTFSVTASVGISLAPPDGDDFDTLLKHADLALYKAKREGRNGFAYFDEELNLAARETLELLAQMRDGIDRNEFELYYQPRIRIEDGKAVSAEALLRWNHPGLGLLMPGSFVGLAEQSGLIHDLGRWVMEQACRDCVAWQTAAGEPVPVSVNASVVQFSRGDFDQQVARCLEATGLSGTLLEVEVTESMLIDDDRRFADTLDRVRELGVAISIDDFGTGYSNFGALYQHTFTTLKIDRSFVSGMMDSIDSRTIVQTIFSLAGGFGLVVVAEGVETEEEAQALLEFGCAYGQGFLWARPLPLGQFRDFLRRNDVPGSPTGRP